MVDIGSGPVKESIDNTVFIIPGIIIGFLVTGEANLTETLGVPPGKSGPIGLIVILIFAAIPGAIIVFFTYKLVKSLRDKARQKEEKKKLKQQKKEKENQRKPKKK